MIWFVPGCETLIPFKNKIIYTQWSGRDGNFFWFPDVVFVVCSCMSYALYIMECWLKNASVSCWWWGIHHGPPSMSQVCLFYFSFRRSIAPSGAIVLNWAHISVDQHTTHKIDHTIYSAIEEWNNAKMACNCECFH